MKHYIWLSVLLAAGMINAAAPEEGAAAPTEEAAVPEEKTEEGTEAPGEEGAAAPTEEGAAAPTEEGAAEPTEEEKKSEEGSSKKSKKRKGRKGRTARNRKKGHKSHKGRKGGHKVHAPSASVLNAYMNRVQSGEIGGTVPESSMSATVSAQGGCATGKCGLAIAEQSGGDAQAIASVVDTAPEAAAA